MAEVSRAEFAELCGISDGSLRKQISRGKIIVHGDGGKLIDTTNPFNKLFKDKQKSNSLQKKQVTDLVNSIPLNPLKQMGTSKAQPRQRIINTSGEEDEENWPAPIDQETLDAAMKLTSNKKGDDGEGLQKWLTMKLKGDAQLVSIRVEKEKLLLDKVAGRLVPVDVAAEVLRSQAKTIFVNFENSIENIANIFCQIMAGGNMDMFTRITEDCRTELNVAVKRAGSDADAELDNIINNYTESRANKL